MRRILRLGFLLMGFTFTVTQSLLIRELLVAFFGNELSIGLILGNWLILEAAGSGLLGRLGDRWGRRPASFAVLQVLLALLLPLCLLAASASRRLIGAIPGEGVGLVPIFWSSLFLLAPLALVDGAMFTFGVQIYAHLTGQRAPSAGRVYVLEAVGAIAGGLVFTYVFIPFLLSIQIALLLTGLNLLCAALIVGCSDGAWRAGRWAIPLLVLGIGCVGVLLSPVSERVQGWAMARQWLGHELLYSESSVYGNVAVVQGEAQYTFYVNGLPILTAPVPDVAAAEEMVHLPLLFVPQPRRVLVLSGGVGGVLHELAKYPVEAIDYAELDPLLIEAVERFPTPLTHDELHDPRVQVHNVDGRLLLRQKASESAAVACEGYDLIIVNLPYPSTLQLNRFYTVEFFQLARQLLAADGVLVVGCPGSLSYMSEELRNLNRALSDTLCKVYDHVRPIPGEVTLWLASRSELVSVAPVEALVERWQDRALPAQMLTAAHIELRLDQKYLSWFRASLGDGVAGWEGVESPAAGTRAVNQDLHPRGLFYGLSYWNALYSPRLARIFSVLGGLRWWQVGVVLGLTTLLGLLMRFRGRGQEAVVPLAVATTGFGGMTADLIVVFSFQTLYGHVYQWIGLLIAAFMGGLGLGGWLMTRWMRRLEQEKRALLVLELSLVLFWVLLPGALVGLKAGASEPGLLTVLQGLLLLLNVLAGFLVGALFPLANRVWRQDRGAEGATSGILYAADLVGAFAAAILVSVVLIPVIGIVETCLLAGLLEVSSLLLVMTLVE